MWDELILDVKSAYKIIEERIYDTEKQNMLAKLSNSNKCILYQHLIDNVCLQYYLTKPINHVFKRYITMFRISAYLILFYLIKIFYLYEPSIFKLVKLLSFNNVVFPRFEE